jgi:hypothetical protein
MLWLALVNELKSHGSYLPCLPDLYLFKAEGISITIEGNVNEGNFGKVNEHLNQKDVLLLFLLLLL